MPSRNSIFATFAGRADIQGAAIVERRKTRAAFTVAHAMIWLSGMPNIMNFDITFGRSTNASLKFFLVMTYASINRKCNADIAQRQGADREALYSIT